MECHQLATPCQFTFFTVISFRLFCFTMSHPFLELPLSFLALIEWDNVGEDTPGDVLDLVLRNAGIVDVILLRTELVNFPPDKYVVFNVYV